MFVPKADVRIGKPVIIHGKIQICGKIECTVAVQSNLHL